MGAFRKVVCQLTGSVDSAVAALLLKRKGFQVTGLFVRCPYADRPFEETQEERAEYAATHLGIPLETVDLAQHHWADLEKQAGREYRAGRCPDLNVLYERLVTLGAVRDYVSKFLHTDLMATAHYARTSADDHAHLHTRLQGVHLFKGMDQKNDDSALLAQVRQPPLRMTLLPLGEFTKDVVSHIARSAGLGSLITYNTERKHDYLKELEEAILKEVSPSPGVFRHLESYQVIGNHAGIHHFKIGQEVEIDGQTLWVAQKDVTSGEIMVVPSASHPGLYTDTFFTTLAHWTFLTPYNFFEKHTMECDFRLHAHDPVTRCQLTVGAHNEWCGNDHIIVSSTRPVRAATPGNTVTFYRGEEAVGSATLLRPGPSHYAMDPATRRPHLPHQSASVTPTTKQGSGSSRTHFFISPIKNFYHRLAAALSQS